MTPPNTCQFTAMKNILFLLLALLGLAVPVRAGITVTNLVPLTTYTAGTNTGTTFVAPQTHSANPITLRFYHSATNAAFPTTNLYQVTFDGGQTWANVGTYINGTNSQNEVWTMPQTTLYPSNRVVVITTTNQTLLLDGSWSQ